MRASPFVPGQGRKPLFNFPPAHLPVTQNNFRTHRVFQLGHRLHSKGFHWEAHEVWEGLWRIQKAKTTQKLLKVLIQITAAQLKLRMKEPTAAKNLIASALKHLQSLRRRQILDIDCTTLKKRLSNCLLTRSIPAKPLCLRS